MIYRVILSIGGELNQFGRVYSIFEENQRFNLSKFTEFGLKATLTVF